MAKWVYSFSAERAEGRGEMKNLLGGKGANLHEMASLHLPVPPGFTITTEVCTYFYANGKTYPPDLAAQVDAAVAEVERQTGRVFGDAANPLLLSVRSGARASMPGMMDTVLNLGLNDSSVETVAKSSGDERFAFDSYRRFIQMYSHVVLDVDDHEFEDILEHYKDGKGYSLDTDLSAKDWRAVIVEYKAKVAEVTGKPFPHEPKDQLWGSIGAVFSSWMNQRAITYRRLNNIPADWGTAVNVQAMVFGNMGETSATGVAFTRNPVDRRKRSLRRVPGQRPGRRCRRRHPHAAEHHRGGAQGRRVRQAFARVPDAGGVTSSSPTRRNCWRSTTRTCRTWSSPSSAASSGCCRHATASALRARRSKSRSTWPTRASSPARTRSPASNPARSTSSCIRCSTRRPSPRRSRPGCRLRPARRAARSCSRPTTRKPQARPAARPSWCASKPRLRTFTACTPPRAF